MNGRENLLITQPQPAGRAVGLGTALGQGGFALRNIGPARLKKGDGFFAREGITEIAPVDAIGDEFRFQIHEQFPQRLIAGFGPQIPHGIQHGAGRHAKHAVVQPAQLMMIDQALV